jgi:hypothetical protein
MLSIALRSTVIIDSPSSADAFSTISPKIVLTAGAIETKEGLHNVLNVIAGFITKENLIVKI